MYVVHVVQSGSGRLNTGLCSKRQRSPKCSRNLSANNGSEVHVHQEKPKAVADALSCQPTRPAARPWLRQMAVFMKAPELQRQSANMSHCTPQDSSTGVMCAPASGTTPWSQGAESSGHLVIHLPSADGISEASPSDPGSCGLPTQPVLVTDSNSLTLRPSGPIQHSPPRHLGLRPNNSGSTPLPTMLQQRPAALQSRPAAVPPACVQNAQAANSLQPKSSGPRSLLPLGLLPTLQWSNSSSSKYWGGPIGGTLYINPPVDPTPCSSSVKQQSPADVFRAIQWGSPIGGTLFINPSLDDASMPQPPSPPSQLLRAANKSMNGSGMLWTSLLLGSSPSCGVSVPRGDVARDQGAASSPPAAYGSAQGTPPAAVAAAAAGVICSNSSNTLSGASKGLTSRPSLLPNPLWTADAKVNWGAPIGGTLYINPQSPEAWPDRAGGTGSSGVGSSSSSSHVSRRSDGKSVTPGPPPRAVGQQGPPPLGSSTRAWGGVPPGVGLAKLGVGLMAAMAAGVLALYLKTTVSNGSNSIGSTNSSTAQVRSISPGVTAASSDGADAAASVAELLSQSSTDAGAAAKGATEGVGFHQWMVQRLQSTLESFEAERAMLQAELELLSNMADADDQGSRIFGGLKRWLGSTSSGVRGVAAAGQADTSAAAAAAAAAGPKVVTATAATGVDVPSRVAEIQEQLDSIDVLRAALSAELAEQQMLLSKASHEQQAAQERLAALSGR